MGVGQGKEKIHVLEGFLFCDPFGESDRPYTPNENVFADAWYGVGLPGFVFPELRNTEDGLPELQQKDDLAICLSGGGLRAGVASYGYVRALHMLGVLQRARYINANSGSAWFAGPFCYQNEYSNEDFFGRYSKPGDLTLEEAKHMEEGSFGKIVADGNYLVGTLLRKLQETNLLCVPFRSHSHKAKYRLWEDGIGDTFFKPVGLNDADSAFCLAGREEHLEAAGVPHIYTACNDSSMPFPIITACVIAPDRLPEATPFVSCEFTPLYSGVPARIEDSEFKLGGVLVESFALCSLPPDDIGDEIGDTDKHEVEVNVQWTTPLTQAVGNSSQFVAMAMVADNERSWDAMGCPKMFLWNGIDHDGEEVKMTDGGGSDNLAIYPALRRGVKKLIICSALAVPVSPNWAKDEFDISGYFGAYPEDETFNYAHLPVTGDVWNRASQVFERQKWDELMSKLTALIDQGEPQLIQIRLKVLPNREQGIEGGYEVDTMWVFNASPTKWWNELPEETRHYIDENIEGFPIVNTFIVDYDPETVSILSNVCTWQILQASQTFASFLK